MTADFMYAGIATAACGAAWRIGFLILCAFVFRRTGDVAVLEHAKAV